MEFFCVFRDEWIVKVQIIDFMNLLEMSLWTERSKYSAILEKRNAVTVAQS
jgi:hypothetical protein